MIADHGNDVPWTMGTWRASLHPSLPVPEGGRSPTGLLWLQQFAMLAVVESAFRSLLSSILGVGIALGWGILAETDDKDPYTCIRDTNGLTTMPNLPGGSRHAPTWRGLVFPPPCMMDKGSLFT